MAAIFGPRANLVTNAVLLGLAGLALFAAFLIWGVPLMHYNTQVSLIPTQPVPFSHKHHVSGLGIDCGYCHTTVEQSSSAGMPSTAICMTCHSQVWTNAAMLAPDRQSMADNVPIRWTRVYTLPDYVYFDHSIHIAKGVGCTECHSLAAYGFNAIRPDADGAVSYQNGKSVRLRDLSSMTHAARTYWVAADGGKLHLIIGIGLVLYMLLWRIRRGQITPAYYATLEVVGIYWSFVDTVWLFLYPCIYLVVRS